MPKTFSRYSFQPHKPADGEDRTYGLVDVYDRTTGNHLGMLNPVNGGGYVLRNTDGVRLSKVTGNRLEDVCYTSRETAAGNLRLKVQEIAQVAQRRAGSVSEGCLNTWHDTSAYRSITACPDCPTQLGLRFALKLLIDQYPDAANAVSAQIYDAGDQS